MNADVKTVDQTGNQAADEALEFFKALSNVDRLKVVGLLAVEPLSMSQIALRLGWVVQAAKKHLDYLVYLGLVKADQADLPPAQETSRMYQLNVDWLRQASRRVLAGSRPRLSKDDFEGEDFERKVLSEWMTPSGTLKAIPQQHKKLLVILRYLLKVFEPGQRYPEKQVNELLRRFHPDTAALRRYLVDEKMLERKDGVYWLVSE
jgi:DNA-binding transcriptional ArsR family regulator